MVSEQDPIEAQRLFPIGQEMTVEDLRGQRELVAGSASVSVEASQCPPRALSAVIGKVRKKAAVGLRNFLLPSVDQDSAVSRCSRDLGMNFSSYPSG